MSVNAVEGADDPKESAHRHQAWVSSVLGLAVARGCGMLASIVLARSLGPADRGAVATLFAWTFTILGVGTLVDVGPAAYFFARKGKAGIDACLAIAVVSAVVLVPVSLAVNWAVFRHDSHAGFAVANWYTLIIPALLLSNVFSGVLLANERIGAY